MSTSDYGAVDPSNRQDPLLGPPPTGPVLDDCGPPVEETPLLYPYLEAASVRRDRLAGVRHVVKRSGTHTFRLQRGLLLACGIVVLAFSAASFAIAVAAPLTNWSPSVGSKGSEVELVGLGFLCLAFGIRLVRVGVQVSGEKVTIRSYFRTRTVDASEIRAITLQPKVISQGGAIWIPRVDLADGTSSWITSFECGSAARPPRPARVATVDALRELLGVRSVTPGDSELV